MAGGSGVSQGSVPGAAKFDLLRRLLEDKLGELFHTVPSDAGLHLFAWWLESEASSVGMAANLQAISYRGPSARGTSKTE